METWQIAIAVIVSLFVFYKAMVGVNKRNARNAFLRTYFAEDPIEVLEEHLSTPMFTSMNVASSLMAILIRTDMRDLGMGSATIAFESEWTAGRIMIRAQELDYMVKQFGRDHLTASILATANEAETSMTMSSPVS